MLKTVFSIRTHIVRSSDRICRRRFSAHFKEQNAYNLAINDEQKEKLVNSYKSIEDQLFEALKNENNTISIRKFISALESAGLKDDDPRLKECFKKISELQSSTNPKKRQLLKNGLTKEAFTECVKENIMLIRRVFASELVIPEFSEFIDNVEEIYYNTRAIRQGKVSDYIPQLKKVDPNIWGVSLCTTDGQRHSIGDAKQPFCLQAISKPLNYAIALNDVGPEKVHRYIGHEPSGESSNEIKLGINNKPHNPMINAGAIVNVSLLKTNMSIAGRFDYITQEYKRLSGNGFLSFNNPSFLSERETSYRNYALGHYLRENKCFPENINLSETLDLYFQLCSSEVTCESASIIAATLANAGICPITGDKILSTVSVQNTLSLMHSCGMYDYSGQWAFHIGLPAKASIAGAILIVVPNVMGIALLSPRLDCHGNSVRGVEFSKELIKLFNFHNYDSLNQIDRKANPRRHHHERKGQQTVTLLFGSYKGDVSALTRQYLLDIDMNQADYDGRTALHIAAAEGHIECVEFLVNICKVDLMPKDRWGFTPLDDAIKFKKSEVRNFLEAKCEELNYSFSNK
ncbi:DgyrCDS5011 [Dimorphilus gyrociliatus]|uniref:glutaminase n=1 Tax=Dimorphilus gyrociliatus TaxID=2664684 RepID=A0A7I8VIP6_9ANNE|nr:DgyrCDS5011 [Dimorphilus gyrociliatus]